MNSQNDDIIIHRRGGASNNSSTKNSQNAERVSASKKKVNNTPLDKFVRQYERHIKILSLVLLVFCALTFIALVSYTPKDEASTNVSLGDFIGLVKGRPDVTQKAETTSNWLGLAGAVISNALYNNTIGYAVIFLPVFIGFCAVDLYKKCKIGEMLLRRTVIYFILGIFCAALMGTISRIVPQLSKEWSGAVGQFMASVMSGLLGTIGSIVIYSAAIIATVYLGTNLRYKRVKELLDQKIKPDSKLRTGMNSLLTKMRIIKPKTVDNPEKIEIDNNDVTTDTAVDDDNNANHNAIPSIDSEAAEADEPARIIRTNMDYSDEYEPQTNPLAGFDPSVDDTRVFVGIRRPEGMSQVEVRSNQPVDEIVQKIDDNIRVAHDNKISEIENSERGLEQVENNLDDQNVERSNVAESKVDNKIDGYNANEENSFETPEDDNISVNPGHEDFNAETANIQDESSENIRIPAAMENLSDNENIDSDVIEQNPGFSDDHREIFDSEINALKNAAYSAPVIGTTAAVSATGTGAAEKSLAGLGIATAAAAGSVLAKPEKKALNVFVNDAPEDEVLDNRVNPLSTSTLAEQIDYQPPVLNLLNNEEIQSEVNEEELKMNARILQEKLETFKIFIENLTVTPGPVVTQYEFVPAAGIKISRIENLADDIAMALKARGIRIIAPVPGKGTVGIEIPNLKPATVRFSSVIKSKKFHDNTMKLPIALGKTISGEVFIADLAKMPHLLVAGATGSGKSVGINTIIGSLIYKMHPRDLKFVIVDPKKVELRQYERLLNHFLAVSPDIDDCIVTDPQDAVIVLKALCAEMDKRYEILASVGQRNIFDYNEKVREGKFKEDKEYIHKPMPFIIAIVDELADLMLTAGKDVETPLIRLAQLARAVGIHCVVATQRPSVDVITGIIKANFPARISYKVASKVDSRTILDGMGAEQLLGNGDMLFLVGGAAKPQRIQNAFISTDEVENICDWIGNQKGYSEPYYLPSLNDKNSQSGDEISKEDRDPLFEEAARLIIRHQQGSVSLIQRRLKVGYARAGRIVDELEKAGVVGPFDGSKARQVYMDSEEELDEIL